MADLGNILNQITQHTSSAIEKVRSAKNENQAPTPEQVQQSQPLYQNAPQPNVDASSLQALNDVINRPQNGMSALTDLAKPEGQSSILDDFADWGRQENPQHKPIRAGEEMDATGGFTFTGPAEGLNADTGLTVEEDRVARGSTNTNPLKGYYSDEYIDWLNDPQSGPVPENVYADDQKSIFDLWGDTAAYMGGNFLEGVHGVNTNLREARNDSAIDKAEFVYDIPGVGQYTNEDLDNITWEYEETPDDGTPDFWNIGYQSSNGNFYTLDQLYNPELIYQADDGSIVLGDGTAISYDEYDSIVNGTLESVNVTNEEAQNLSEEVSAIPYTSYAVFPDGGRATADEINSADYNQSDDSMGFLNFNKVDPEIPIDFTALFDSERGVFDNFGDFVPFMTDVAASSVPYMIPGYNYLTAASTIAPELEGYNSMTYDPDTGTYADETRNNAQSLGGLVMGPGELVTEKLGGIVPGVNLRKGLKSQSLPRKLLKTTGEEALEEVAMTPIEELQQSGFDDFFKDRDEFGNSLDTDPLQRFLNFGADATNDATAGALMGLGLSGPAEVKNSISNRYNGRQQLAPEIQQGTQLSQEQIDQLLKLLSLQGGN